MLYKSRETVIFGTKTQKKERKREEMIWKLE
jgi:hypothetical protein